MVLVGSKAGLRGRMTRLRRTAVLAVVLPLLAFDLSACSAFLFDDDELEPQRVSALPPADQESYPNLASVPDAAPLPSSRVRRLDLAESLASDRDNAVYTDEPLISEAASQPQRLPPPSPALPDLDASPLPPDLPPGLEGQGDRTPLPPLPPRDASLGPLVAEAPTAEPPPAPPAAAPVVPPSPTGTQSYQQPVLLQQQAVQQQIFEAQQLQNMALQQQAYAAEARRQAIEQQQLRDQIIEQRAMELKGLQFQARQQLAILPQSTPAVPPMSYPAYNVAAPTSLPPVAAAPAPLPPTAPPVAAYGYGAAAGGYATAYGAPVAGYAAQPAQPAASGAGQLVGLIYFGHGSAGLDDTDRDVLRQIVALQQQTGGRPLRVVGHASARTSVADPVKHRMANFDVSVNRAQRVANALVQLGASRDRVAVVGKADSEPVYHEFMPTGEAGNRRVEIFIE